MRKKNREYQGREIERRGKEGGEEKEKKKNEEKEEGRSEGGRDGKGGTLGQGPEPPEMPSHGMIARKPPHPQSWRPGAQRPLREAPTAPSAKITESMPLPQATL